MCFKHKIILFLQKLFNSSFLKVEQVNGARIYLCKVSLFIFIVNLILVVHEKYIRAKKDKMVDVIIIILAFNVFFYLLRRSTYHISRLKRKKKSHKVLSILLLPGLFYLTSFEWRK